MIPAPSNNFLKKFIKLRTKVYLINPYSCLTSAYPRLLNLSILDSDKSLFLKLGTEEEVGESV